MKSRPHWTMLLVLLTLVISSCTQNSKVAKEALPACAPITEDRGGEVGPSDPFTLKDARISGNCLEVDVQFGGGCGEETWQLVWNGKVRKTDPVSTSLRLVLKDNDRCKKGLMKTYSFDLSPLQPFAASQKEVRVNLEGFDQQLVYTF